VNQSDAIALSENAAVRRLAALAPLSDDDLAALARAANSPTRIAAHREILREGAPGLPPGIVLSGWACRVRQFSDGRRQILSFLLPGELIGMCHHREPLATTSLVALTPVDLCTAPPANEDRDASGLAEAYAVSGALEEFYLFRQIARLGRLSAYERMLDWMFEMRDRLELTGQVADNSFPMPITQEGLADALGLTSVHVNRTLQLMRREGLVELRSGIARLIDPQRLMSLIDYRPAKVTAAGIR
jgi:CRP-like cAMP-binding protein